MVGRFESDVVGKIGLVVGPFSKAGSAARCPDLGQGGR